MDAAYSQTITASGGTGAKTLAVSNVQNAIPGLNVPASGTDTLAITGTPTAAGTETFMVTATDTLGAAAWANYSITVNVGVIFGPLPDNLTVLAGAPLNVALNVVDPSLPPGSPPGFYSFRTPVISNFNLANPTVSAADLQAGLASVLDCISNQSVMITVSDPQDDISGTMILQLFEEMAPKTTARIIALANGTAPDTVGPFYDGLIFHRVIKGFMIQGGDPLGNGTGGSGVKFDDEFTPQLQFTSAGILAMANSGPDTNDSQFFITDTLANNPYRYGDFKYAIFGFLTKGQDILDKIEAVPTGAGDKPVNNVVMTSVSVAPDGENRTLHLSVPEGTTGTVDVTVSFDPDWNGQGSQPAPVTHTFHITIAADAYNDPPFLGPIVTLRTTANTTLTYQIPATDVEGDPITYTGTVSPANSNVTFTVDPNTGLATIQTQNNWAGVAGLFVGVTGSGALSPDTQMVPLVVNPGKPAVTLLTSSDTGPSNTDGVTNPDLFTDNTRGTLGFNISNLTTGTDVVLYVDGAALGQATAISDTMVMRTPATFVWTEGTHMVTVKQTLNGTDVTIGNATIPLGLASDLSDPLKIVIDTTAPQITSTPPLSVVRGQTYAYNLQCVEEPYDAQAGVTATVQYSLIVGPAGMQIDAQTGAVTWTPGPTSPASAPVTLRAADLAGNTADQSYTIQVQDQNLPPHAYPQTVRIATALPGPSNSPATTATAASRR